VQALLTLCYQRDTRDRTCGAVTRLLFLYAILPLYELLLLYESLPLPADTNYYFLQNDKVQNDSNKKFLVMMLINY
jgi:hypothetical protein